MAKGKQDPNIKYVFNADEKLSAKKAEEQGKADRAAYEKGFSEGGKNRNSLKANEDVISLYMQIIEYVKKRGLHSDGTEELIDKGTELVNLLADGISLSGGGVIADLMKLIPDLLAKSYKYNKKNADQLVHAVTELLLLSEDLDNAHVDDVVEFERKRKEVEEKLAVIKNKTTLLSESGKPSTVIGHNVMSPSGFHMNQEDFEKYFARYYQPRIDSQDAFRNNIHGKVDKIGKHYSELDLKINEIEKIILDENTTVETILGIFEKDKSQNFYAVAARTLEFRSRLSNITEEEKAKYNAALLKVNNALDQDNLSQVYSNSQNLDKNFRIDNEQSSIIDSLKQQLFELQQEMETLKQIHGRHFEPPRPDSLGYDKQNKTPQTLNFVPTPELNDSLTQSLSEGFEESSFVSDLESFTSEFGGIFKQGMNFLFGGSGINIPGLGNLGSLFGGGSGKGLFSGLLSTGLNALIPGFGGALGGLIGSILPFAKGGVVTRPMLGLVGEAGPEAIIPLNRIPRQMPQNNINVNVTGELRGRGKELYTVLKRVERLEKRIK